MQSCYLIKKPKIYNGKKVSSTNDAGLTCYLYVKEKKIDPYLSPCTKLKSKWINDFNIKPDKMYIIKKKVGKSIELIGTGGIFLN